MKCELCPSQVFPGDILCRLCRIRFDPNPSRLEMTAQDVRNNGAAMRKLVKENGGPFPEPWGAAERVTEVKTMRK